MNSPNLDAISSRLEQIEHECDRLRRQACRWQRAGILGLVGGVAIILIGAGRDDELGTVEADRFVLRGRGAKVLATLDEIPDQGPALTFFDLQGKQRINLSLAADGKASIGLFDRDENPRIGLGLQPDGLPALSFIGRDGKERGGMSVNADGSVALGLFDGGGKPRVRLSSNQDGTPH